MPEIILGSIVTIRLNPEKYPNSPFQGKQGEVVLIANDENHDGPIGVSFPDWYEIADRDFFRFLRDYGLREKTEVIRFEGNELEIEADWRQPEISDERLCDLLFDQSMWHTRRVLRRLFIPGFYECMYEECEKKAFFRILVNCYGVVVDFDVCPEHAIWHGKSCDGFPAKK